jgi:hypothetical protein
MRDVLLLKERPQRHEQVEIHATERHAPMLAVNWANVTMT